MPARKIKIALIEDSQTVRFFYRNVFMQAGFEVFEAENAKDGWDLICDHKPDVIVLDMNMPKIPGIELLKRIRTVEFSKDIPVLVLTSVKEAEQVQQIFKEGASHYVLKGMDSPDIIKRTVYDLLKSLEQKRMDEGKTGMADRKDDKAPDAGVDRLFWWY